MSQHHPLQKRKNSGVTWIGDIPAHWQVARIKAISTLRNARQTELPTGALYIGLEDVESGSGSYRPTAGSSRKSDDSTVSIFRDRDVLYGKLRPYLKKAIVAQGDGACSTEFLVLDVESKGLVKPEWLHGWLLTHDVTQRIEAGCDGAKMPRASWEHVSSIHIPVPPPEEQAEILESLDGKTSRIDTLIAKKTRFIELLKEKILARIIASTSPRCEWDEFPFWRIARTKSISGRSDENLLSVYLDRGVIPYSEGGGLVHKPADSLEKYQLVEPGDLVMNNQQAWRGSLGVSPHRGIVSPAYLVFSLDKEKIDPSFANYAFRSGPYVEKFMLASMSVGDIQRQLKWPHLRKTKVSVPSLGEQRRIASDLDLESKRISSLISKTERSIELLKEHRAALITAAVTGKIDVREAA